MRIAIVEDDDSLRVRFQTLFETIGHNVILLDAYRAASLGRDERKNYDLVLIDRRAHDWEDPHDTSGDEIARRLWARGTPSILLTRSISSQDQLFDLLRTDSVTGVIYLSVPMPEIVACVHQYRGGSRFANCIADFEVSHSKSELGSSHPTSTFWREIRRHVEGSRRRYLDEEYAVLFRRLISPCARKVVIEMKAPGRGGGAVVRASISFGDGPLREDLAVKYGLRNQMLSEAMHYDRFVGPLPDGVATQLRLRAETQHLGALAYSWVGDSIEDGVPLGPPSIETAPISWQRRLNVIQRLFDVSLSPWYSIYRNGSAWSDRKISLLDHYIGRGGLWYHPLNSLEDLSIPPNDTALPANVVQSDVSWDFISFGVLPNPVTWAAEFGRKQLQRFTPCHGDLHVRNIYALPDDSARLIDFGSTTLGHLFRDFAALEVSLRLTCVDDTDQAALCAAENRVCDVMSLGHTIDGRGLGGSINLRESVLAAARIRQAAFEAKGYLGDDRESLREYLFAVVLHMLRYASGTADEVSAKTDSRLSIRIWHAMYGAARAAKAAIDQAAPPK